MPLVKADSPKMPSKFMHISSLRPKPSHHLQSHNRHFTTTELPRTTTTLPPNRSLPVPNRFLKLCLPPCILFNGEIK